MLYNIHFELAAIFFLLVVFSYLEQQKQDMTEAERCFRWLVLYCILANALDVATAFTISYARYIPIGINVVFNSTYYAVATLASIYFSHYVLISQTARSTNPEDSRKKTVFYWINRVISAAYFLLLFVNLFTGVMYTFSPEGEYVKGPLFLAGFYVPFYFVFYSAGVLIKNIKSYGRMQIIFIISFIVLLILGNLLQLFVLKGVLFSFFCAALAIPLVLFGMETPDYKMLIKTQKELEAARDEAQQANEDKNAFLASMSHEIRTPINAVMGMNEMILRECKSRKINEYARDIENAANGLLSIVNDILDISKIESGEMEITPIVYDLSLMANDSFRMVEMRIMEKKLKFSASCQEGTPRYLYGDAIRLKQILVNLLTNAVKYTHQGSISLDISYEKHSDKELLLRLKVSDTGIGISKEDQKKLFISFERFQKEKNRKIEGTGLGLAITGQLVKLMGGTIEVASEVDKGSCFTVELLQGIHDLEPVGNLSLGTKKQEKKKEKSKGAGLYAPLGKVLIVDDMAVNLKVAKGLLRDTGLETDTALSGMACIEKTMEKKYHVIYMDHMMPEMDGIKTFRMITENPDNPNKDTPVVMLTANAVSGAREEYLKEGFKDYLSKPIKRDKLIEMTAKYLPGEVIERMG